MSQKLEIGQKAPSFSINNQDGKLTSLQDFAGKWLVLYFYPKDNTPGCTVEATDFSKFSPDFAGLGAVVVGVSPDSEKSHCRFIEKQSLSIELLSDPDHQVAEAYGAWGLKKFMGKEYMGILRSTFSIDPSGNIAYIWPNVKTKGHAEAVLQKIRELQR
ncbi:thioredoxin-dependent thiol peroxidase [Pannus brasiliensis CCIBt3594]|uniref:thioredoxin-dependent peroxiredoxin n=1 Tax=Pannus brasiliensis CCIBt3594 TaxID=1427578 RepID=A0AAW9QUH6_9CHRO